MKRKKEEICLVDLQIGIKKHHKSFLVLNLNFWRHKTKDKVIKNENIIKEDETNLKRDCRKKVGKCILPLNN